MIESHRRSILKAITWRIVAVTITTTVAFVFTHEAVLALEIGVIDSLIKLVSYYVHERAWNKSNFGRDRIEYRI